MLHSAPSTKPFDIRRQIGELESVVNSTAGSTYLAECYTGWPKHAKQSHLDMFTAIPNDRRSVPNNMARWSPGAAALRAGHVPRRENAASARPVAGPLGSAGQLIDASAEERVGVVDDGMRDTVDRLR